MYAVIETGGKQYRVEVGTELEVEYLDVQPGDAITLDRVLLVADEGETSIGQPLVSDALVRAEVVRQARGEKVISFKYRPKARSRVKKGHRQELTVLRVTDVRLGGRSAADDARASEAEAQTERDRVEEAAARQAAADAALAAKLAEARPSEAPTSAAVRRRAGTKADEAESATSAAESGAAESATGDDASAEAADTTTGTGTAAPRRPRASRAKATTEATTEATTRDASGTGSTDEDA